MKISAAAVKAFMKRQLATEMTENGVTELRDDLNLVDSGLLDSIGLLQLVMSVQEEFKVEIELGEVDPELFTTVAGFASIVTDRSV